MSSPPVAARNHGVDGSNTEVEKTMAKTAGFVVFFSEIVFSILKSLNPFNSSYQSRSKHKTESTRVEKTLAEPPTLQEQHVQIPVTTPVEQNVVETTRAVEIVKGDTLWGLSRKYGVSIKAIKEANGLTNDIIYAVKKLNIP